LEQKVDLAIDESIVVPKYNFEQMLQAALENDEYQGTYTGGNN